MSAIERLRGSDAVYRLIWLMNLVVRGRICWRSNTYWRELHGKYRGRRGFVIGNGPSLRISDLTRLKDEVCIASNKVYLAYPETPWRPTLLTCADRLVWEKIRGEIHQHSDRIHLLSTLKVGPVKAEVVLIRNRCGFQGHRDGFATDILQGAFGGRTVTYTNLQIAAHLGLNPIYLIGCDHYYRGEAVARKEGEKVVHEGGMNHFVKNYRQPGEIVNSAPIEQMTAAFENAFRVASAAGIEIRNATRGGYLEAFPRVDLDHLLDS